MQRFRRRHHTLYQKARQNTSARRCGKARSWEPIQVVRLKSEREPTITPAKQ